MTSASGHVEHVPVIGQPSQQADERAIVIFDCETGRKIGASPHVKIEQVSVTKTRGTITTTLKIRPIKGKQ